MSQNPLHYTCPHTATPQEQERDPTYLSCNANPNQPCHWANRFDGVLNPPFHSERLEAALQDEPTTDTNPAAFTDALLETGLI